MVEGFYTTPVQIHHPLETHGNTVSWTDEGITAWASTQGISSVRDGFGGESATCRKARCGCITEYMGGGFGAKFGAGVEGVLAAKLSQAANAPVRLMLTRFDQALAVGNRPSSFQKIKMGATADGKLHAFELENYGTAGIGARRFERRRRRRRGHSRSLHLQSPEHPREAIGRRHQCRLGPRFSRARAIRPRLSAWNR